MDYVIIVAGGSSRRFGSDKLLTNVGSEPVVRRVLEASSGLGEQVVLARLLRRRYVCPGLSLALRPTPTPSRRAP